eukprot:m.54293 g.54293  ORF g.54293 m.54293 type:complete len:660 (+) comp13614_c0_seq1:58-2037(+)
MEIEPKYEFDALQYVDFASPTFLMGSEGPDETTLNAWFAQRTSNPGSPAKKAKLTPTSEPMPATTAPSTAPVAAPVQATRPAPTEKPTAEQPASSTATSAITTALEQAAESTGMLKARKRPTNLLTNWGFKKKSSGDKQQAPAPAEKQPKRSASIRTRSASQSKTAVSRPKSAESTTRKAAPAKPTNPAPVSKTTIVSESAPVPRRNRPRSTRSKGPKSPSMMARRRQSANRRSLSSEELELLAIKEAKAKAAKVKRRARRSFDMVMHGPSVSTEILTTNHSTRPVTVPEPFQFASDERLGRKQHAMRTRSQRGRSSTRSAAPSNYQPTATVVEPFHFSHLQDPVSRPTTAEYVPMMAAVNQFQSNTPERYHKPAKDAVFKPSSSAILKRSGPTQAHSPNLTKPKVDKSALPSSEDLVLADMASHAPFKARPVNPNVMESDSGTYGVPKVMPKACTVAQSPAITKVLPRTDAVATQEPAPAFKAQPMPDLSNYHAPTLPAKPTTKPAPFSLASHRAAEVRRQQFETEVKVQQAQEAQLRVFKAAPPTALSAPVFVPSKSTRPLTSVGNVTLASDARAKQRQVFDAKQAASRTEAERQQAEVDRQRKLQEQAEIQALRQTLVHKASTIRQFNSVAVQPSELPLTEPKSPNFVLPQRAVRM